MAMKNAKQDIRLSSVVSLEKDVANYRDTIKTMKASHADELLLLREAHEAEVKTLTTTIGQLQRELKRMDAAEEKEEEERFRVSMLEKLAEEERIDQLNAQKRRTKQIAHRIHLFSPATPISPTCRTHFSPISHFDLVF